MALPDTDMTIEPELTALVITDPQNDFLSPEGALETAMHSSKMFDRKGPLDMEGFNGSGADCWDYTNPTLRTVRP